MQYMSQWIHITSNQDVENIWNRSIERPQLLFKHSTRCGISLHAQERLMKGQEMLEVLTDLHYLDLLEFRSVSQYITEKSGVFHQSPQIILVFQGKVIYTASHQAISAEKILEKLTE